MISSLQKNGGNVPFVAYSHFVRPHSVVSRMCGLQVQAKNPTRECFPSFLVLFGVQNLLWFSVLVLAQTDLTCPSLHPPAGAMVQFYHKGIFPLQSVPCNAEKRFVTSTIKFIFPAFGHVLAKVFWCYSKKKTMLHSRQNGWSSGMQKLPKQRASWLERIPTFIHLSVCPL